MRTRNFIPSCLPVSRFIGCIAALLIGIACTASAAGLQVTATINPSSIGLGDAAQLSVTVQGNQGAQPSLPNVAGLQFTPVGQSSSFQVVNGSVSSSVSYTYQVIATRTGTFDIPSIRVGNASTRPLALRVIQQAGGGGQGNSGGSPAPNSNQQSGSTTVPANSQMAFLRVVAPKHDLYVGEVMPIQIKAYFRSGMSASLNGLPTLSSDAFTMTKLTQQPAQTQEVVNGIPYTVVTWPSALSAVKAGDYSLDLDLPVLVRVRQRGRRDPFESFFGNSGFDDPFFDGFFGQVTEKPVTLQSEKTPVTIQSLPTEDVPAGFSGAVGQFQVRADVSPKSATVGDPLTLKFVVSGKGNFDRVDSNGLPDSAAWKTYKPGAKFEPADSLGVEGSKTFEQAVVAKQAGHVELPTLVFSYFDPDARKYVTRKTQPIPLEIAPGSAAVARATPPAAAPGNNTNVQTASVAPASPAADSGQDELFPNAVEPGNWVATLQPMLLTPGFVAVPAASLALLFSGLWYVKKRDQLASDPAHLRKVAHAAAVRQSLAQMDSALRAGDATTFFASARRALRERLAHAWNLPAGSVTLAEVTARLGGSGEEICSVFRAADQTAYSGQGYSTGDLEHWRKLVHAQLKTLDKS